MATITFGHHALLASNRKAAILGTLITIILALMFTGLQAFEYAQSSFTIADSVFGSAFFCATGLHGLNYIAPNNFYNNKIFKLRKFSEWKFKNSLLFCKNNISTINYDDKLCLINSKNNNFFLENEFINWLTSFTDAEGNFNINLRNFKDNKYNSLNLTD